MVCITISIVLVLFIVVGLVGLVLTGRDIISESKKSKLKN